MFSVGLKLMGFVLLLLYVYCVLVSVNKRPYYLKLAIADGSVCHYYSKHNEWMNGTHCM